MHEKTLKAKWENNTIVNIVMIEDKDKSLKTNCHLQSKMVSILI